MDEIDAGQEKVTAVVCEDWGGLWEKSYTASDIIREGDTHTQQRTTSEGRIERHKVTST